MNRPLVVVFGDKGFLGKRMVSGFLSKDFNVIGLNRETLNIYSGVEVISEVLDVSNLMRFVFTTSRPFIVINCVRDDVERLDEKYFEFLGLLACDAKVVINFSTYIQHYSLDTDSRLKTYRDNQLKKSEYLEGICESGNILDITLFTVYGPEDSRNSFLSYAAQKLFHSEAIELTGLEQLISYTYVDDVVTLIQNFIIESRIPFGRFSFWQTPPLPLQDYFNVLMSLTQSNCKPLIGNLPYKGHELFSYNPSMFPPQITNAFSWTSFEVGLESYL